ncbi:MAG TPA: hypothetical protein VFG97_08880 [Pedococcus sp.]|nr:hypothetical protein [Pedococcus sp.]
MTDHDSRDAAQPSTPATPGSAAAPAPSPRPGPLPGQPAAGGGEGVTGDALIDAALRNLEDAPADDLDAQIAAGQRVHQTLQARLSDLGGE